MKVLIVTKIFPNPLEPLSSPFNRQQFSALSRLCDVEVLATIPWFPGARAFREVSAAGRLTRVPETSDVDGLTVKHPRFFFLPRYGHFFSAAFYAASLLPLVAKYRGRVDVLLGSWAYPDGAAAVMLGQMLGVPTVVKLHGSDLNVVAEMRGPKMMLKWTLPRAARVVAVSRPLAEKAMELGVAANRCVVVPNGVDSELFYPRDRAHSRGILGLAHEGPLLVYVGRLEHAKGVIDLVRAFERVRRSDVKLVFIGDGSARGELARASQSLGDRVRILGARPLNEIPLWMAASTALVLPSHNEGTPNVLLEAFACGRPAVATRTGGIPDLITSSDLGELTPVSDEAALASALTISIERDLAGGYDEARIISLGARGGWAESAARLHKVLVEATRA